MGPQPGPTSRTHPVRIACLVRQVHGEDEFLFAPYSTFTVRSVVWEANPVVSTYTIRPHRIEVDVLPDNRRAPPDLPLAPWC